MPRLFLLPFLFLIACNGHERGAPAVPEVATAQLAEKQSTRPDKVIVSGHLMYETEALDASRETILHWVSRLGGYVEQESGYRGEDRMQLSMTIRIPAHQFDSLQNNLRQDALNIDDKGVSRQDASAVYTDTGARMAAKKALEKRYLELLPQAKNMTDVLAIEQQLNQLRSEIEAYQTQLNDIDKQVAYATLQLTVYEKVKPASRFSASFKTGIGKGWQNLVLFSIWLVNLWPFVLILLLLGWMVRRRRKNRQKKSEN